MMTIEIRHGRVIDPKNQIDRTVTLFVSHGRIVAIGDVPPNWHAQHVIDASGLVVAPGLVDLSVRLREPGSEHRATLVSELAAAVAGGVTSLVCPPDTHPPLDEPGLVEMLKHRARQLKQAHVYPLGALTKNLEGSKLTNMGELVDAGCVAFSQADSGIQDTQVLLRAMQYAATFDYQVWLRPLDLWLAKDGVAHDGEVASRLGLPSIPVMAEVIALQTIISLMRETGVRVHIMRLSSRDAIALIAKAKAEGLPITADVSINNLHLSDMDIGYFDPNAHLVPPLRAMRDRDALRQALADGTIDALVSDHTPVDDDSKQQPFAEAEAGATGLELLLPLALKWAAEMRLPLSQAIACISTTPAAIAGLDAGHLSVGQPADIVIFDPEAHTVCSAAQLHSQGKHTPFLGYELPGRVNYTLVDGKIVFEFNA